MDASSSIKRQNTSSEKDSEMWLNQIPIPRILEIAILELKKKNSCERCLWLERIILTLCFSLPPNARVCSRILESLLSSSFVWERLEKGLSRNKSLSTEVYVTLCKQQPLVLENEVFHVFSLYGQNSYTEHQQKIFTFTVESFKSRGLSYVGKKKENGVKKQLVEKENVWLQSEVIDAAMLNKDIFISCFDIFLSLAVDVHFSYSFVLGVSDFFSCMFHKLGTNIYKYFPCNIQNVIYLLTLPLCLASDDLQVFENLKDILCIETVILQLMSDYGIHFVQSLLCFFPYWLAYLLKSKFLEKYLQF